MKSSSGQSSNVALAHEEFSSFFIGISSSERIFCVLLILTVERVLLLNQYKFMTCWI